MSYQELTRRLAFGHHSDGSGDERSQAEGLRFLSGAAQFTDRLIGVADSY
jgi:hypothetical protein